MARWLRLLGLRSRYGLAAGRWSVHVFQVRQPDLARVAPHDVTAGTIFDRTRTPLTVWFTACWLFATGKDGISALSLKRTLEIGSSSAPDRVGYAARAGGWAMAVMW